jgi:acyl-CoA dehydrogenase
VPRVSAVDGERALSVVQQIAREVAGPAAAEVDAEARFPREACAALREAGLLAASLPPADGGAGWDLGLLARAAEILGESCASTGLVWAMQHSQLLALARHTPASPGWRAIRGALGEPGGLVASVASELTTGASFLTPGARLEAADGGAVRVCKPSSRVSYGEQADAFLVSAAPATAEIGDPATSRLVFVWRREATVKPTGTWHALGMRGTETRLMALTATVPRAQLLDAPFPSVLDGTMIPVAHTLWASCWVGIARGAIATARAHERARAETRPSTALAIADAAGDLDVARALVERAVEHFATGSPGAGGPWSPLAASARYNEMKRRVAALAGGAVLGMLTAIGLPGYLEDSDFSVARRVRDVLSASVMVNDHRLRTVNAELRAGLRDRERLYLA